MSVVRKCQRKGKPSVKRQEHRELETQRKFEPANSSRVDFYGGVRSEGGRSLRWKINAPCAM